MERCEGRGTEEGGKRKCVSERIRENKGREKSLREEEENWGQRKESKDEREDEERKVEREEKWEKLNERSRLVRFVCLMTCQPSWIISCQCYPWRTA